MATVQGKLGPILPSWEPERQTNHVNRDRWVGVNQQSPRASLAHPAQGCIAHECALEKLGSRHGWRTYSWEKKRKKKKRKRRKRELPSFDRSHPTFPHAYPFLFLQKASNIPQGRCVTRGALVGIAALKFPRVAKMFPSTTLPPVAFFAFHHRGRAKGACRVAECLGVPSFLGATLL